jgi:hypothetical protein
MVESFGIQSWPEGLLETEKSPNLNELEPAFSTKTLTLPDLGLVLIQRTAFRSMGLIFLMPISRSCLRPYTFVLKCCKLKPEHDLC